MKKKLVIIFLLLFQLIILIGYFEFINFGNLFSFNFLFDEEFVIMLAIFLVFFLSFKSISEAILVTLNDRIIFLEKSFSNSYDLIILNLNNSLNVLNKLISNYYNSLHSLNKIFEKVFYFCNSIENKKFFSQNIYFNIFFLRNLLSIKFLF